MVRGLENKGKGQLVIDKSGRGRSRERSLTRALVQSLSENSTVFAMLVVTRAGRLQEWSQGELRL